MLQSLFLRFISRNVASIVKFVEDLDKSLETFLAKHDAEVAALEDEIVYIKDEIETKVRAAAIVTGLKTALPTAK